MAELPSTLCTEEHIVKVKRNVDNTPLTDVHKDKIRAVLALLQKTWDEECVLPGAPRPSSLAITSPAATPNVLSPNTSSSSCSPTAAPLPGLEEAYYCATTQPTKGKLQQVPCIENYSKASNPLHLAAKISTHHKDYFSVRCLIRTLWANKWSVEKTYEGLMKTVLWRHQFLPRYWTEEETRECARMRYMDWYGITKEVRDPVTGSLKEARCAILQLRAHCSDVGVCPESRCRFVLLALEKGLNCMRQIYHGSQTKVLEEYAKNRPNEPFVFHDSELQERKKDKKEREKEKKEKEKKDKEAPTPTNASSPTSADVSPSNAPPKIEQALRVLEEAVRGAIPESQARAAASASPSPVSPELAIGEEELLEGSEQLLLIMDETMSASEKMDTKFLRFIAPLLNSHYVERLRSCYVINPTFITSLCVGIIKIVVDERTKSKLNLIDVPPMALDEFLAEYKLTWPGRTNLNPSLVAAGESAALEKAGDSQLTPKELEKKDKERRKAREKRAKDLEYDDVVFPCQEVIDAVGIESTPMKYGGFMPPLSANQFESWFHSIPPFADPSQQDTEHIREATRVHSLKK